MNNTLLKIATFTLFVGLVGTFVAYKAGFWGVVDGSIQLSPNGSALNGNSQDSTAVDSVSIDPEKFVILPSSKSFQVGDDFFKQADTAKTENEDSVKKKKKNKGNQKDVIMPSSKSGPMFN